MPMIRAEHLLDYAKIIDKKPFIRYWSNVKFDGGYGSFSGKNSGLTNFGHLHTVNAKILTILNKVIRQEWTEDVCSFHSGVILFCVDRDKVTFDEEKNGNHMVCANCISNGLHFPTNTEEAMLTIWNMNLNFIDFLEHCKDFENNFDCDIDSCIEVYKLQGDEAIFGILCQLFWKYVTKSRFSCCLVPEINIKWLPKVDEFVSGTTFPAIVTPSVTDFRWVFRDNGWFLEAFFNGKWRVFDVAGIGNFALWKESTEARKQFWANGGEIVPFLVCWTWFDVVQAVGQFKSDVIIRDCRTTLCNQYWFLFGNNAKLVANSYKGKIQGRNGVKSSKIEKPFDCPSGPKQTSVILSLNGEYHGLSGEKAIFNTDEIEDFFELNNLAQELVGQ